jgi:predicted Ser/Thr protein kinase
MMMTGEASGKQPLAVWKHVTPLAAGRGWLPARCDIVHLADGQAGVLKDFSVSRDPLRRMLGRIAVGRERRAYQRLNGLAGFPQLLDAGADTLLLRYIANSAPVNEIHLENPAAYIRQFEKLLDSMHARGVSHGEIRLAHVLADTAGQPWLVDFATATVTDPSRPSLIFRVQKRLDRYGWLSIKERFLSGVLTPDEQAEQRRNRVLAGLFRRNVI